MKFSSITTFIVAALSGFSVASPTANPDLAEVDDPILSNTTTGEPVLSIKIQEGDIGSSGFVKGNVEDVFGPRSSDGWEDDHGDFKLFRPRCEVPVDRHDFFRQETDRLDKKYNALDHDKQVSASVRKPGQFTTAGVDQISQPRSEDNLRHSNSPRISAETAAFLTQLLTRALTSKSNKPQSQNDRRDHR
ncbi:hypothetical protein QBC36DRAFT_305400 [Triangularia setosa]|uniref:Uncharacterized protein n=1 Tax=Triangularia setosa TaxID=2587417 RepID=A0AAN6VXZ5_9PEZI|nr:hypothetical protein QBC36DRAFT_305400 [Podospora setosa]